MYAISTINKRGETVKKVFIFIMVVAFAVLVAVRVNQFVNPSAVSCEAVSTVAHYGDTYWTLEQEAICTGGYDKRDRVDAIIEFNGGSATIQNGQMIYFPQDK